MLFAVGWALSGLVAQGLFMWTMKQKYPEQDVDWDLFPIQAFMSILAGPVALIALAVVCESEDENDLE